MIIILLIISIIAYKLKLYKRSQASLWLTAMIHFHKLSFKISCLHGSIFLHGWTLDDLMKFRPWRHSGGPLLTIQFRLEVARLVSKNQPETASSFPTTTVSASGEFVSLVFYVFLCWVCTCTWAGSIWTSLHFRQKASVFFPLNYIIMYPNPPIST